MDGMKKELNEFDLVILYSEFDHYSNNGCSVYNVYGIDCYGSLFTFKTVAGSSLNYEISNYNRKLCRVTWSRRGNSWVKVIHSIKVLNDNKSFKTIYFDWENN